MNTHPLKTLEGAIPLELLSAKVACHCCKKARGVLVMKQELAS